MLNFIHHIPTKIYFGKGQITALSQELKKRAKKILITTGQGSIKKNGIFDDVMRQVKQAGVWYVELSGIQPNPRLKSVYSGIEICKKEKIDFILGIGGGSVIDASKAIAVGAKHDGDVWDFFVKDASPNNALPLGCVLTLAATGTEANGNAVISNEDTQRKLALITEKIKPAFSILDPEYTYTVNKFHTAAGVADIMAHVFEQYFSHTKGADAQDRLAEGLLKTCIKYGPVCCKRPRDYEARANILWASTLALNGLIGEGKEQDWACHAIEHEISAIYDISHGAGLAIIFPNWMIYVLSKETLPKFAEYGINVWGIDKDKKDIDIANGAISKTKEFFTSLDLPKTLTEVKVPVDKFSVMAKMALKSEDTIGSFKPLGEKDIVAILKMSV
ncbi:MAG: iron-containing alcohol dehydrogenase [Candidatus Omnitrophota bacterium]